MKNDGELFCAKLPTSSLSETSISHTSVSFAKEKGRQFEVTSIMRHAKQKLCKASRSYVFG